MMNRTARRNSPITDHRSPITDHRSPITPLLLLILSLAPAALAQRIIPESSSWTTLPASHPLGSGEIAGTNTYTSSSQAGFDLATNQENGFFFHRGSADDSVGTLREGSDFQVCLTSRPAGAVGLMVRDSAEPDAPFVFFGFSEDDQLITVVRRVEAGPMERFEFGPATGRNWVRLVVGTDTVYAYTATERFSVANGSENWTFVAAERVDLRGNDDLGGLFVETGTAVISELYHTSQKIWSERTVTADGLAPTDIVPAPGSTTGWEPIPPAAPGDAISEEPLGHNAGEAGGYVDFRIPVVRAGRHAFFLHVPVGSTAPLAAEVRLAGAPAGPPTPLAPDASTAEWLSLGDYEVTNPATVVVRVKTDAASSGGIVLADAARAVLLPPVTWASPDWDLSTKSGRLVVTSPDTVGSLVRRDAPNNIDWNAGVNSGNALIGDGIVMFRSPRTDKRYKVALSPSPTGNGLEGMEHRFFVKNGADVTTEYGHSITKSYDDTDWLSMERIGDRVLFRQNTAYFGGGISTLPSLGPLFVDCSIRDDLGRFTGLRLQGWTFPAANRLDIDEDGVTDTVEGNTAFNERWVIDADPEDAVQSVYDVVTDTDGDGLSDEAEFALLPRRTNPAKADTDEDGLSDFEELTSSTYQTDPTLADSDGDGLSDGEEVNSIYGFNPLLRSSLLSNGQSNGISDFTRWEILTSTQNTGFTSYDEVLPDADFDDDGVNNLHESEDGTSAANRDDYFHPVSFGRLFGDKSENAEVFEDTSAGGVKSTRIVRDESDPNDPGDPAGGVSHHEVKDGTRVRFQFVAGTGTEQFSIGFSQRGEGFDEPGDLAEVPVAIRRDGATGFELLYYGVPAPGLGPFAVSETDWLELRVELIEELPTLTCVKSPSPDWTLAEEVFSQPLPAGFDPFGVPVALVVQLPADGGAVRQLRYRRVHDPDADDDGMADAWELLYGLDPHQAADAALDSDLDENGALVGDGLSNLEEYQRGTDPLDPDTDGDGMRDGWEVTYGLDPLAPADGAETADLDGDGLSNRREHDFGSRPDLIFTMEDGFSDTWKERWNLDPNLALDPLDDPDGDGLNHTEEFALGTNPNDDDSDGDGFLDGWETENGFDPLHDDRLVDSDEDGLLNTDELAAGTDPLDPDSDDDDLTDGDEVHVYLTQPKNPDSDNDGLPDGWEVAGLIMHFDYESFPAEPVEPGVTYGPWVLEIVDELPGGDETRSIYRQEWTRPREVYDWRSGHTNTFTETLERIVTVHADGFVEEPADGWHHDSATDTLVQASATPTWTTHYDETSRLWVGIHETETHKSTWWWVHTDPNSGDTDGDGLPDLWEYDHWLNPDRAADATENPDHDLVDNTAEYSAGTHPWRADTDGDALSDGHELTVTFSDPLDPSDPGSEGGAIVPATPGRTVAKRTEFLTVESGGTETGAGGNPPRRRASTLTGRGGRPPVGPPPLPYPTPGPLPTLPGASAPNVPVAPPEDELYLEWRLLEKSVSGSSGEDPSGGDFPDPDGDDDGDGIANKDDDDWLPLPGNGGGSDPNQPPPPPSFAGKISYTATDQIVQDFSEEYEELEPAVGWANRADIDPSTDWRKSEPEALAGAYIAAHGYPGYANELEVRLVRKTDPGAEESYAPVEVEVKRSFLKVTRSRPILENGNKGEWTVHSAERVELSIPVRQSKSAEDAYAVQPDGVLEANLTEDEEMQVLLLPVEVVQPKLDEDGAKIMDANGNEQLEAVDKVRFCRWRWEVAGDFSEVSRQVEGDRFHFRIPKSAEDMLEGVTASIRVDGIRDNATLVTEDPSTDFEFGEYPLIQGAGTDHLISPPFYLVADAADDETFNGNAGSDNQKDDTTHLGGFGANITLEFSGHFDAQIPFKAINPIGTINVKLSYLVSGDAPVPSEIENNILSQFKQMRDIYRQLGIDVKRVGGVGSVSKSARMEEILDDNWINGKFWTDEYEGSDFRRELLNNFAVQQGGPYIHCVFTSGAVNETSEPGGLYGQNSTLGYFLKDGLGREIIFTGASEDRIVLAHEVGHALGLPHTNDDELLEDYYLMSPIVADQHNDDYEDQKRFRFSAPGRIEASPNFKSE